MIAGRRDRAMVFMGLVMILGMVGVAGADVVDISVETDKQTYLLGEEVQISVIAYNPSQEPVTLTFPSSLTTSYRMDDIFDWKLNIIYNPVLLEKVIEPLSSYTRLHIHDSTQMELYPLDIGMHSVRSEVVGYGLSEPVNFEVVPEPITSLLMAVGAIGAIRRKRRKLCN